jgi:fatty-acyl-CoA synthase
MSGLMGGLKRGAARLRDEAVFLYGAVRTLRRTSPIARHPTRIFPVVIDELANRYGDKPALVSDRETLTYRELAEHSRRYARWAQAQRIGKGGVVGLMMGNRPEYVAIWLGIIRAGGTVALLNTNLAGPALAYCIDIVKPSHLIVAADLVETLASSSAYRTTAPQLWLFGEAKSAAIRDMPRLDEAAASLDGRPLTTAERPALSTEDQALFIYTSGTTGRPKAANINHFRLMLASEAFAGVLDAGPDDRMYDCLPMYHTSGGVVATGATLFTGGTVFIRDRFSATEFWNDVVRHRCTSFMYIGELCRYLLNTPPQKNERNHSLRICCGNGLRYDIWDEFKTRFAIPRILEFYAATEGNLALFNFEGKPGAVGRIPWYLKTNFPTRIVRFDVEKEAPVRNAAGFCEEAPPGEVGEAIARIFKDPSKPAGRFEGYADTGQNGGKVLHNVFEPDDTWFRSGDLMRRDSQGYFYFIDRIGDTFRWKGENVSTTEVSEALCTFPGITDANVYGVAIAGREGRAGMAAIMCEADIDLAALRSHLAARLPDYARPLFLRIRHEVDVTATFKQRKIDLLKDGFDPDTVRDPIFFDDPTRGAYVRLDGALYRRIVVGEIRL